MRTGFSWCLTRSFSRGGFRMTMRQKTKVLACARTFVNCLSLDYCWIRKASSLRSSMYCAVILVPVTLNIQFGDGACVTFQTNDLVPIGKSLASTTHSVLGAHINWTVNDCSDGSAVHVTIVLVFCLMISPPFGDTNVSNAFGWIAAVVPIDTCAVAVWLNVIAQAIIMDSASIFLNMICSYS